MLEDDGWNLFPGNSRVMKVMKPLWYGRCSCICTSSTHQIGTNAVKCPSSSFCMVLHLLQSIQWCVLELVWGCIMWSFASSASLECISTTFTHGMPLLSGLPRCTLLRFSSAPYAGFSTVFSARRYRVGRLTRRAMHCGMCSWVSIHTLQTHSWCSALLSNEDGPPEWSTLWVLFHTWRLRNRKLNETSETMGL